MMVDKLRYKRNFRLPAAEADIVCALALELKLTPDQALQFIVRMFVNDDREFAQLLWQRATADGRGKYSQ